MSDIGQPPSGGMLEETGQAPLVNLALNRPALQSSTDIYSSAPDPAEDARGAVSGSTTGGYGFHTGQEEGPWWQVDLGGPVVVREVVVFNRGDQEVLKDRAIPLEISVSDDGLAFQPVHLHEEVFDGRDGAPLRWSPEGTVVARFVRLTVRKLTCLHLDEVEVYGRPVREPAVEAASSGGGMGQTSALGAAGAETDVLSGHHEVAKADLLPSLPLAAVVPEKEDATAMRPSATADQGLELMGNDAPRELGEPESPRSPFWKDAVTSEPVDPAAAAVSPPTPPESFLTRLRRALFGD